MPPDLSSVRLHPCCINLYGRLILRVGSKCYSARLSECHRTQPMNHAYKYLASTNLFPNHLASADSALGRLSFSPPNRCYVLFVDRRFYGSRVDIHKDVPRFPRKEGRLSMPGRGERTREYLEAGRMEGKGESKVGMNIILDCRFRHTRHGGQTDV